MFNAFCVDEAVQGPAAVQLPISSQSEPQLEIQPSQHQVHYQQRPVAHHRTQHQQQDEIQIPGQPPRSPQFMPQALQYPHGPQHESTPGPPARGDICSAVVSTDEHRAVLDKNRALANGNRALVKENIYLRTRIEQLENQGFRSGVNDSAYETWSQPPNSTHEANRRVLEIYQSHNVDLASDVEGETDAEGEPDVDGGTVCFANTEWEHQATEPWTEWCMLGEIGTPGESIWHQGD